MTDNLKNVENSHYWHAATIALHSGYNARDHYNSAVVPIYQSSSYVFDNADHAAALFMLEQEGHLYSRTGNPTADVLEQRIASLEGGIGALAVSSGMSAIDYAISTLAAVGDHVIAITELYGGTYNFFNLILPTRGIKTSLIDKNDFTTIEAAIHDKTKAIFVESIGNPGAGIADLERIVAIAHHHGIVVVVDNTVASPLLIRPFDFGADIIIHSVTKYIGGHGNTIGGVIVDSGHFDWQKNVHRYPQFTTPEPSYHGINFVSKFGKQAYIVRARAVYLRNLGAALSANSAFLILQGLETLALRIRQISENTQAIIDFLAQHPLVEKIHHVTRHDHPDHHLLHHYLGNRGMPGILSFELHGGRESARKFYNALQLFLRLVNIGDSKSLVTIPSETTHRQMTEQQLYAMGVSPGTIRLSIGIESIEDLIQDLSQALEIVANA